MPNGRSEPRTQRSGVSGAATAHSAALRGSENPARLALTATRCLPIVPPSLGSGGWATGARTAPPAGHGPRDWGRPRAV
jgi:hypothetical protein